MSNITFYGPAVSSYVRTARLACAEKGVPHELKPIEFGSPAHRALHPFCKVPIMERGETTLIETLAIVHYLEAEFGGPALVPKDAGAGAEAHKWVSLFNAYLYQRLIPDYCLKYVLPKLRGEEPDRDAVSAGLPGLAESLDVLEAGIDGRSWYAGEELSIADLFVAPAIAAIAPLPEAAAILETKPNIKRFMTQVAARDSWKEIMTV